MVNSVHFHLSLLKILEHPFTQTFLFFINQLLQLVSSVGGVLSECMPVVV